MSFTSWQHFTIIIISIISGMLLCCKNLPVLLWGPFFVGAPVRLNMLNMLNMPKSASHTHTAWTIEEHKSMEDMHTSYNGGEAIQVASLLQANSSESLVLCRLLP